MADKSSQLILTALSQAAASARGLPLFATRTTAGLFPSTAAGKQAAQRCQEEGLLHLCADNEDHTSGTPATTTMTRKSRAAACCVLTDKGLSYLLAQVSPRQVLEDFVRVLEARQVEVAGLETLLRTMHADLGALRANTEKVIQGLAAPSGRHEVGSLNRLYNDFRSEPPASENHDAAVLALLTRWQESGACEDCPLPDLYRQLQAQAPALSIGQLHDSLRHLHDTGRVYLHPWTGPLYDLPEPPYALLIGHEIAYYASLRK